MIVELNPPLTRTVTVHGQEITVTLDRECFDHATHTDLRAVMSTRRVGYLAADGSFVAWKEPNGNVLGETLPLRDAEFDAFEAARIAGNAPTELDLMNWHRQKLAEGGA